MKDVLIVWYITNRRIRMYDQNCNVVKHNISTPYRRLKKTYHDIIVFAMKNKYHTINHYYSISPLLNPKCDCDACIDFDLKSKILRSMLE